MQNGGNPETVVPPCVNPHLEIVRYLFRRATATIFSRSMVVARCLLCLFVSSSIKMRNVLCIVTPNGTSFVTTKVHPRSRSDAKIKWGNDGTYPFIRTSSGTQGQVAVTMPLSTPCSKEGVSLTARTAWTVYPLHTGGRKEASSDMLTDSWAWYQCEGGGSLRESTGDLGGIFFVGCHVVDNGQRPMSRR